MLAEAPSEPPAHQLAPKTRHLSLLPCPAASALTNALDATHRNHICVHSAHPPGHAWDRRPARNLDLCDPRARSAALTGKRKRLPCSLGDITGSGPSSPQCDLLIETPLPLSALPRPGHLPLRSLAIPSTPAYAQRSRLRSLQSLGCSKGAIPRAFCVRHERAEHDACSGPSLARAVATATRPQRGHNETLNRS